MFVFLCPHWLSKVLSGARWWCVQLSLGASRIVGSEIWVDWFVGYWLHLRTNVHADRHCDPRDARLAVHLYTTNGKPVDCVELNHQNQRGQKYQCGHYPGKRRVRGRCCCKRCNLGWEFLTLVDSIDVVLCPGCLTLWDSCVVRTKDGDVKCFSERMS